MNHFHTQCLLLKSCGMSQFSYDKYTQFPVKMEANYLVYCKYEGKQHEHLAKQYYSNIIFDD